MQSWNIAKLAAMFGILYGCSFTEPLTLLRDVIFDKVYVIETFFWEIDRLMTGNLGIYWQLCLKFFTEPQTLSRGTHFENHWNKITLAKLFL